MSFTEKYKDYFNNIVKSILKNLNNTEYDVIFKKYCELIDYIYLKFLIKDESGFYEQLKRNNNQEIIAILYLFFPYIEDTNNYEKFKLITKLSDITLKKNNGNYEICNFQFSRGYYDETSNKFNEYPFSIEDININFELLKQSIERLRIKLYVNWVNIVPILLENYKESQIYKDSEKYYLRTNSIDKETLKEKDTALPIAEIYDTLVNELYMNTLDFKWLLFEKSVNKKIISYIDILDQIYPVYNILNDINGSKWLLLDENKKELFTKNMDLYFSKAEKNITYNNISAELLNEFFKNMLLYFDTKYKYVSEVIKLNKGYRSLIIYDVAEIDVDDDYENKKTIDEIFNNYKNIDKYYLYDFIRLQIIKLSKTWYGFKMFQNNKIIKLNEHVEYLAIFKDMKYNDHNIDLSYKNIYNFSKRFFYYTSVQDSDPNLDEYIKLSQTYYYDNLNIKLKKELNIISDNIYNASIIDNSTNFIHASFFNIRNNIDLKYKEYGYNTRSDLLNINRILFYNFNRIIFNIIFECLCKRGILSEYIIRKNEFELKNLNQNNNEIKKKINQELFKKHLQKYENANYYLNDDKYKNLPKIYNNKRKTKETYFERLLNFDWYNFYAMDWVSQINFYHHYINQRIVFLTGGTGVGKSTQVPKLLLYGLKAFDKKFNGKIICTQPRIAPTRDNSARISAELGYNITEYSPIYNEVVKTTNGIIQYKYEQDDHIDDDQDFFLRIVTDGSLLNEIKQSPLLKQPLSNDRKTLNNENKTITLKNIYDIIIVDESHEHNVNMDLILTMLRGSIFFNNQLKLYIISATMKLDDPLYRKFYRCINDNLKYPIRDFYDTEKKTYEKLLDRIVIDRRIHISPPNQTTRFKINEIYNNEDLDEISSYEKAKKYALDICNNSSPINNDILLFCTTSSKIIKLVDELNTILPTNTLAIPFYRDLPEESKNIITTNLGIIKEKFKFDRKDIHNFLNKKMIKSSSNNKYDRILIVSTNIAEASITIDTLKYVIDTGFNLNVSYNYETLTTNISVIPISEASRLQRKGRVGRVNEGFVYYTYTKGSRENIQPEFAICNSNFKSFFLDLLDNNDDYNKINYLFKNKSIGLINDILKEILSKKNNDTPIFEVSLIKLMIHQYITIREISEKQYISENLYNYNLITEEKYQNLLFFGNNGINSAPLIDEKLDFYLIHPFENKYSKYRNKYTNILDTKYKNTKIISKDFFNYIIRSSLGIFLFNSPTFNSVILKTKLYDYLVNLRKITKNKLLDMSYFYPLIISHKFNIFEIVLFIIYFLINVKNNILTVVKDIEKFNYFFGNKQSDILLIYNIYSLFKKTFPHILYENNTINLINDNYINFFKIYKNFINKNTKLISLDDYNYLIKLLLKNDDISSFKQKLSENIKVSEIPNYIKLEINKWCNNYGINYDVFLNIINVCNNQYNNFKYILSSKTNTDYIDKSSIQPELTIEKSIIKALIYGNISNIFIYKNNKYIRWNLFDSTTLYNLNTNKKKWISNVAKSKFIFVYSLENDTLNQNIQKNEEETNNAKVNLDIITSIDNQMYIDVTYLLNNPTNPLFNNPNDTNLNYVCNNSINLEKYKHSLDPELNEYINLIQKSMKNYIETHC